MCSLYLAQVVPLLPRFLVQIVSAKLAKCCSTERTGPMSVNIGALRQTNKCKAELTFSCAAGEHCR